MGKNNTAGQEALKNLKENSIHYFFNALQGNTEVETGQLFGPDQKIDLGYSTFANVAEEKGLYQTALHLWGKASETSSNIHDKIYAVGEAEECAIKLGLTEIAKQYNKQVESIRKEITKQERNSIQPIAFPPKTHMMPIMEVQMYDTLENELGKEMIMRSNDQPLGSTYASTTYKTQPKPPKGPTPGTGAA